MNTNGFNHIAVMTQDLGRFCTFYGEVFGAVVEHEEHDGPIRMCVLRLGPDAAFNVFEVSFSDEARSTAPMFRRGRIDHLALNVPDRPTFEGVVAELVERGLTDGVENDFGRMQSVSFEDPDGMWLEVCVPDEDPTRPWHTPRAVSAAGRALA